MLRYVKNVRNGKLTDISDDDERKVHINWSSLQFSFRQSVQKDWIPGEILNYVCVKTFDAQHSNLLQLFYHNHNDNFLSKVMSLENVANYHNITGDKPPKMDFARRNKTALGHRGQAEASLKIQDLRSNKTTGKFSSMLYFMCSRMSRKFGPERPEIYLIHVL